MEDVMELHYQDHSGNESGAYICVLAVSIDLAISVCTLPSLLFLGRKHCW